MAVFWLFLVTMSQASVELHDGLVTSASVDVVSGGDLEFSFYVNSTTSGNDVLLTATTFSDWSSPELFVSAGTAPTTTSHDYSANPWNVEEVEIPAEALQMNTTYYILVHCATYCRFNLVFSLQQDLQLPTDGSPVRFALDTGQEQIFSYQVREEIEELTIVATPLGVNFRFEMNVTSGDLFGPQEKVVEDWFVGQSCDIRTPQLTTYLVSIVALESLKFLIAGYASNGVQTLQASSPMYGAVALRSWQYYKVYVDDPDSVLYIMETIYSGTPRLYVRAGSAPTSSLYDLISLQHDNETISIEKHQREAFHAPTGWYYIGIYGSSPSTYILTASINKDGMVPLYPGVSHSGFVDEMEKFYYYLEIPTQSTVDLTINLHFLTGDLDVYAKLCLSWVMSEVCKLSEDEVNNPRNHPMIKVGESVSGGKEIAFRHTDQMCSEEVSCRYVILVVGKSLTRASFFIITSFDDSTEHSLRNGISTTYSLPGNSKMFFKFLVIDERAIKVNFQLTTFAGICRFCFSPENERPIGNKCLKETLEEFDAPQVLSYVRGEDAGSLNLTYYLTVRSFIPSTFSLLASQQLPNSTTLIRLISGQQQQDVLYKVDRNDAFRLFSFDLHYTKNTQQDVYLTLTPFSGRFNMFVSNNASQFEGETSQFRYNWATNSTIGRTDRANSIHITTTDPNYLSIGTYLVLVQVQDWAAAGSISYSIMYSSGDGSMTLQPGIPLNDIVETDNYRFYEFPFSETEEAITISLTAMTGDPDLFISVQRNNSHPRHGDYSFSSESFGSDVYTVLWSSEMKHMCYMELCTLHISVFGCSDSAYSITANTASGNPVYIVHGSPLIGKISLSQYAFYYTIVKSKELFQVSVQSYVGEVNLYVNLYGAQVENSQSWSMPDNVNYNYKADTISALARVTLLTEVIEQVCKNQDCKAGIGVRCKSPDCRYSISASQTALLHLLEGTPQSSYCHRARMTYFQFYNNKDTTNIIASVTAITSGNPDLYISKGIEPEIGEAMWFSQVLGNEFLEITSTDKVVGPNKMKGEYFLGVSCDKEMTFSVTVTTNEKGLERLIDGQPHTGLLLRKGAVDYFYYPSTLPSSVIISLTPSSGDAVLYALPQDDYQYDIYQRLPSASNYQWSASAHSQMIISKNDTAFCLGCNIVLAVVSTWQNCMYTLLARNEGHVTTLLNGQPTEGRLFEGQERKYVFQLVELSDIDISLMVFSGEPVMYIATSPLVSQTEKNWTTEGNDRTLHVHITPSDPAFHLGLYYILVRSGESSSFSLTAHSTNSIVRLVDGWPQTYSCAYLTDTPILLEYLTDGSNAMCKLISLSKDFYPSAYVNYYPLDSVMRIPSKNESNYQYTSYDIFYQLNMPFQPQAIGKYIFAIYGNSSKSEGFTEMGDFQFYCSSASRVKVISINEVEFGYLDTQNQLKTYQLSMPQTGIMTVVATPCYGSIVLKIASNSTYILGQESTIKVTRIEDGRLTASFPCDSRTYFIFVAALSSPELSQGVSYQLTTTFSSYQAVDTALYYPGNSGDILWDQLEDDRVRLSWSAPETKTGESIPSPDLVRYRIYATESSNVSMSTACGMDVSEAMDKAWLVLPDVEEYGKLTAIVELPTGIKMWVNVLAIVDPEVGQDIYHVPYTPAEIVVSEREDSKKLITLLKVFAGLLLLMLIGLFVLFFFYRKAKKLEMQLVEMLDVQTITGEFNRSLKSKRTPLDRKDFVALAQEVSAKEEED